MGDDGLGAQWSASVPCTLSRSKPCQDVPCGERVHTLTAAASAAEILSSCIRPDTMTHPSREYCSRSIGSCSRHGARGSGSEAPTAPVPRLTAEGAAVTRLIAPRDSHDTRSVDAGLANPTNRPTTAALATGLADESIESRPDRRECPSHGTTPSYSPGNRAGRPRWPGC